MADKKLNNADFLLLLLYSDNKSSVNGAIRLMKMMFLFEKEILPKLKEIELKEEYEQLTFDFYPHDFGPFSKEVYEQIELFKGIGFITIDNLYAHDSAENEMIEVDDFEEDAFIAEMYAHDKDFEKRDKNKNFYKYEIAQTGIQFVEEKIIGQNQITSEQMELLSRFKAKINTFYPKQLLKYVYTNYPEYTSNSLIKGEVLGNE